ncbi:MAG: hypothetical protein ABIN89_19395 [Chitinophagaceae bacterium]
MILLGDGGMGKTVSLIHFWKTLLESNSKNGGETIPLFITLLEYNSVTEDEYANFIAKRIAWHYLGLKEDRGDTINLLWDVFKIAPPNGLPNILLLLD